MKILIPMAGRGKRFEDAGYSFPKPLIDINGKTMIEVIVENLNFSAEHIFLCRNEHYEKYSLKELLELIYQNCKTIKVNEITEGAACTALLAKELINNNEELIIANSDQFVEWDSYNFISNVHSKNADGGILTFEAYDKKWSFVKVDDMGFVTEVAEKKVISKNATVGVYYWKHGSSYVSSAEKMIKKNIRVNNEFYVCPVYNEFILEKKKVKIYNVDEMQGLGTPEDLNNFLRKLK